MSQTPDRTLLGVGMMIAFALIVPVSDTFVKLASAGLAIGMVVFLRFLLQALLLAPLAWAVEGARLPPRAMFGRHLLRAGLLLGGSFSLFTAFSQMPLANAIAIFFVQPFILGMLGAVMLGESFGWRRISASGVGFAGALLVIQPSFSDYGPVAFLPLVGAVFVSFYFIATRRIAGTIPPMTLQCLTALGAMVLMLPVLGAGAILGIGAITPALPADALTWWYLLGIGVAASVAHVFGSYALRFAPAATVAPVMYLEIVAAAGLGLLVFGDWPDPLALTGMAIIIAAGLYVFWRERQVSRAAARPAAP